jgi:DNA recombination protein RmuC
METILLVTILGVLAIVLLLVWQQSRRSSSGASVDAMRLLFEGQSREIQRIETALRSDIERVATAGRAESSQSVGDLRREIGSQLRVGQDVGTRQIADVRSVLDAQLAEMRGVVTEHARRTEETLGSSLTRLRSELNEADARTRQEIKVEFGNFRGSVQEAMGGMSQLQGKHLADFGSTLQRTGETMGAQVDQMRTAMEQRLEAVRGTVEERLAAMQKTNEQKLDEMRRTVDEQLQSTLERRLGESFKLVSERLELVHKGLGEMQQIASSVGKLEKVLGNVKTRGIWGELQLHSLIEQMLTPEQFIANYQPRPRSQERVEFAIRFPGSDGETPVYLPIDAKFPTEDHQRLIAASEAGDVEAIDAAAKALENRVWAQAKDIRDKYIVPPTTTDFAIMYLPSESLYAEVLRRPGLMEQLQREYRVTIAGPTTLAAMMTSLQMGFRTLAIQKRSSEVWGILAGAKDEFRKFGDNLDKVKKHLDSASSTLEETGVRTRAIERRLRSVESTAALGGPTGVPIDQQGDEPPLLA